MDRKFIKAMIDQAGAASQRGDAKGVDQAFNRMIAESGTTAKEVAQFLGDEFHRQFGTR